MMISIESEYIQIVSIAKFWASSADSLNCSSLPLEIVLKFYDF